MEVRPKLVWSLAITLTVACDSRGHVSGAGASASGPTTPPSAKAAKPELLEKPAQSSRDAGGLKWSFDDGVVGTLPPDFSAPVGEWSLAKAAGAASGANVLAQSAQSAGPVFNLLLTRRLQRRNVDLSVGMRARSGKIDQGGGLVWRARDRNNYYIARYNPLEGNYRVYTVVDGERRRLAGAAVKVDPRAWHTLRVKMLSDHIQCLLDGIKHLDVRDSTFPEGGRIGLWTKADAKTQFDDMTVRDPE